MTDEIEGKLKIFVFNLILFFIILVLCEATLRVSAYFSPTIDFILSRYQWEPLVEDDASGPQYSPVCPDLDDMGFRNPSSGGKYGVLALGDSNTLGLFVEYDKTWPRLLGAESGLSVYNMGRTAYSSVHYTLHREQIISKDPDHIVFVFYTGNDLFDSYKSVYNHTGLEGFRSQNASLVWQINAAELDDTILKDYDDNFYCNSTRVFITAFEVHDSFLGQYKSYWLARNFYHTFNTIRSGKYAGLVHRRECIQEYLRDVKKYHANNSFCLVMGSGKEEMGLKPGYRILGLDLNDPRIREGLRLNLAGMGSLHDLALGEGSVFHVVILPSKEYVYYHSMLSGDGVSGVYADLVRDEESVIRITREFLRSEGISYIDLTASFNESMSKGTSPYFQWDGHINGQGHNIISKQVSKMIGADHLRPSR
ncbi:hypothetical protein ACFLRF_06365 [Candidatus Altiarchaeota archaeon]